MTTPKRRDGKAEGKGLEEGREEGKEERSIEIARSLMGIGMPTGQIAAITKLTEEQVKALL